jgi:hypothetical protein
MQRIITILGVLLVFVSCMSAQYKQGNVELSFSGNFGSSTTSVISGGQETLEKLTHAYIAVAPSYYVFDGFSLEAELALFALQNRRAGHYILGNISYTARFGETKSAVFGRFGIGTANAVRYPLIGDATLTVSDSSNVGVFNFGGGYKYLVAENIALRAELNYKLHFWEETIYLDERREHKVHRTYGFQDVGLLFGFSVIF